MFLLIKCHSLSMYRWFQCGLPNRWPRWVFPQMSVTYGSNSASRSTVGTRGTLKPTATRRFLMSVVVALTGSTSAQPPWMVFHVWPQITWLWSDWRSWTVDATLVITGESTVAFLLGRKTQININWFQFSFHTLSLIKVAYLALCEVVVIMF